MNFIRLVTGLGAKCHEMKDIKDQKVFEAYLKQRSLTPYLHQVLASRIDERDCQLQGVMKKL